RNRERHDHAIAYPQGLILFTNLDHLPHVFMPEDVALSHGWNIAVVEMQIGPANGGCRNLNNRIARIEYGGVRHGFDSCVVCPIPAKGFHVFLLSAFLEEGRVTAMWAMASLHRPSG